MRAVFFFWPILLLTVGQKCDACEGLGTSGKVPLRRGTLFLPSLLLKSVKAYEVEVSGGWDSAFYPRIAIR